MLWAEAVHRKMGRELNSELGLNLRFLRRMETGVGRMGDPVDRCLGLRLNPKMGAPGAQGD